MKASVIIVNFNGHFFLEKLMLSLFNQTFRDFEIIIVDNHSNDKSLQLLAKILSFHMDHPHVKILRESENLGYCAGNNAGLNYAHGEYVVFLNNDTYVSHYWLEELIRVMENDSAIGACQSRHIKARTNEIQTDGWLLDKYGWSQRLIIRENTLPISKVPFYLSGASFIVKRSVMNKIGGFDPHVFFGDFDICWRLRLLGYDMATSLRSLCYHYGGVTTGLLCSSTDFTYNHFKEILRVFTKNLGPRLVLKRIAQSMSLMEFESLYLALRFRNASFILSLPKALIWNLLYLKETLLLRAEVQSNRKLSDKELKINLVNFSVLLKRKPTVEIYETQKGETRQ